MREIKFRGLRADGKGWAYGGYYCKFSRHTIITDGWDEYSIQVIPETVGQFTGHHDKEGTEIFEGDVDDSGRVMLWNSEMCLFCWHHWNEYRNDYFPSSYPAFKNEQIRVVVTGNIHTSNDKGKEGKSL